MFHDWAETGPRYSYGPRLSREHSSVYPSLSYSESSATERVDHKHAASGLTHSPRQRTPQACEKCRDRKTKCSGGHPVCQRCETRGLTCVYPNREKRSKARLRFKAGSIPVKPSPAYPTQKSKDYTSHPLPLVGHPFPLYPHYVGGDIPSTNAEHGYSTFASPEIHMLPELSPAADISSQGVLMNHWVQVPTTYYNHPQPLYPSHTWEFMDRPSYMKPHQISDASSDSGHSSTYSGLQDSFPCNSTLSSHSSESFDSSSSNLSYPPPPIWPLDPEPGIQLAELELAYQRAIYRFGGIPSQLSAFDEHFLETTCSV